MFLIGATIKLLQSSSFQEKHKHNIVVAIIVIFIPILSVKYTFYSSTSIWALPFVLILIFLLFNDRRALTCVTLSALFTQILLWIINPNMDVKLNGMDYVIRICLFLICIKVAFFVNKLFVNRLSDNAKQIKFQTLVSDLSSSFLTINEINCDQKFNEVLKKCSNYFDVDKISLVNLDFENKKMKYIHECSYGLTNRKSYETYELQMDCEAIWFKSLLLGDISHIRNDN